MLACVFSLINSVDRQSISLNAVYVNCQWGDMEGMIFCVGNRRITAVGNYMPLFLPLSFVTVLMVFFDLFLVGFGAYVSVGGTISSCFLSRNLSLLQERVFHFLFFTSFRSFPPTKFRSHLVILSLTSHFSLSQFRTSSLPQINFHHAFFSTSISFTRLFLTRR